ncbi:hypothetical protein TNCV_1553281 [Trichonephila clavipes]|nr:hypothetical protein TNCV_1553281 [Trichonephila clavipes]
MQALWFHEAWRLILSLPLELSSRNRDSSLHAIISSPLHFTLCAPLPRQNVQANIEQWYSRRSTAPETHTVERALHSPFTDCTTGTVIQLGGNLC